MLIWGQTSRCRPFPLYVESDPLAVKPGLFCVLRSEHYLPGKGSDQGTFVRPGLRQQQLANHSDKLPSIRPSPAELPGFLLMLLRLLRKARCAKDSRAALLQDAPTCIQFE